MALESATTPLSAQVASGELLLEDLVTPTTTTTTTAEDTAVVSSDNGCPDGGSTDQTVPAIAVEEETFSPEDIAVNVSTEPAPPYGTVMYDPDTFEQWLTGGSITNPERKNKIRELRGLGVPTADLYLAYQAGGDEAVDKLYDRFKNAVPGVAGATLEDLWKERRLRDASPGRGKPGVINPGEVYFEYGDSYLLHATLREFYQRDLTAGQKKPYREIVAREERLNAAVQGVGGRLNRRDWRNVNAD
jgi:hypothetical protein